MRAGLVVVVLVLAGCPAVIPSHPDSTLVTAADRACTKDGDCTVSEASCCDCSGDGKKTAINVDAAGDVGARFSTCPTTCPEHDSDDETCCATGAACIDDVCELTGPRGETFAQCQPG